MSFLSAIGAFIVSFLLLNLVLPAGVASVLAAIIAVVVYLGNSNESRH